MEKIPGRNLITEKVVKTYDGRDRANKILELTG